MPCVSHEGWRTFFLSREQGGAVTIPTVVFLLTQKAHDAVFGSLLRGELLQAAESVGFSLSIKSDRESGGRDRLGL